MELDDENLSPTSEAAWYQATVSFPGDAGATPAAAAALVAGLHGQRYWFMRKLGRLRLRTEMPAARLLDQITADGLASGWIAGIYEPELLAFGGPEGMDAAHTLFCADSPAALADTGRPGSRERCVLLISSLLRGAGLDRYEAGDVWAKFGAQRPELELAARPSGEQRQAAIAKMRRMMNADAALAEGTGASWPERVAAFETAGRQLAQLAADGLLTRGLRAVLAHHVIFTLNRGAVGLTEQSAVAWLAKEAVFAEDRIVSAPTGRSPGAAPKVGQMEATLDTALDPAELRQAMVGNIAKNAPWLDLPESVTDALLAVERHVFVPEAGLQAAYRDDSVSVKTDAAGVMISCASQPTIIATQLEQLGVRPGDRVLEAGAATGYNAALLGRIAGKDGHVFTVDVDDDLVSGAREHLAGAGVENVTVRLADGAAGLPQDGPFDRIQFTVGTGDIPAAVFEQLAPGGRVVVPMRIRGSISRSFAFERDDEAWKTTSTQMATFVPLRKGILDDEQTMTPFDGPGDVKIETFAEQDVDLDVIRTLLDQPGHPVTTGVTFRAPFAWEWLYLWLTCALPNGLSRMPGQRPGFTPHFSWGGMAALEKDSLAYLTLREDSDEEGGIYEIGVTGHGQGGESLAEQVAVAVRNWDRHGANSAPAPTFRMAYGPARDALNTRDARFVVNKPIARIAVDWP